MVFGTFESLKVFVYLSLSVENKCRCSTLSLYQYVYGQLVLCSEIDVSSGMKPVVAARVKPKIANRLNLLYKRLPVLLNELHFRDIYLASKMRHDFGNPVDR